MEIKRSKINWTREDFVALINRGREINQDAKVKLKSVDGSGNNRKKLPLNRVIFKNKNHKT